MLPIISWKLCAYFHSYFTHVFFSEHICAFQTLYHIINILNNVNNLIWYCTSCCFFKIFMIIGTHFSNGKCRGILCLRYESQNTIIIIHMCPREIHNEIYILSIPASIEFDAVLRPFWNFIIICTKFSYRKCCLRFRFKNACISHHYVDFLSLYFLSCSQNSVTFLYTTWVHQSGLSFICCSPRVTACEATWYSKNAGKV